MEEKTDPVAEEILMSNYPCSMSSLQSGLTAFENPGSQHMCRPRFSVGK